MYIQRVVMKIFNNVYVEEILRETAGKEIESQLDIISSLKEELILLRTDIVYRVGEVWNKFISFSNEELTNGENRVNLSVLEVETNKSDIKMENISQMLSALNTLGELKRYIRVFSKTLLQHFIKPVLCEGSEIVIFHQAEYGIYVLYTKKSENFLKINDPESAVCALSHLAKLFEFLNINFSPYNLEEENKKTSLLSLLGNESYANGAYLFEKLTLRDNCQHKKISKRNIKIFIEHYSTSPQILKKENKQIFCFKLENIGEEFIKLVLNNCLEESIPSERKELKNFNQVQQKVEEFHQYLVEIGFYAEDHKSLLNFVSNVEVAFGNKTCSDLLFKGRNLMTKSLNVTANIESLSPEGPLVALVVGQMSVFTLGLNREKFEISWSK
ncbi:Centromere/kinetochore protein zw10-like protein [Armadillidium vulgare]|nr:Centromere/kinetochore protein zw10-like protein [Armadillidium vulgare]